MKSIFLENPPVTQESAGGGMEVLIFYGLIILIMYKGEDKMKSDSSNKKSKRGNV